MKKCHILNCRSGIFFFFFNAEALVAATKEIGLEVNAHKTKYVVHDRVSRSERRTNSQYEDG